MIDGVDIATTIKLIQNKLEQDKKDAHEYGDILPSNEANTLIISLAKEILPLLPSGIKYGVFTEDEGGISFTIQSLLTHKRLNFRVSRDGDSTEVVKVGKNTCCSLSINTNDVTEIKKHINWIIENDYKKQTILGSDQGNCYSTCIACLLNIPIEDVPNFCAEFPNNGDFMDRQKRWILYFN